jgi:hypothetical protein
MAPHGKQMTPEEKRIIVALAQQGYSSYKIAEMTGKNRRTNRQNRFLFSRLTGEIVVFLQTGLFLYPSKFKRLRTVLEEILVTNWRLNWCYFSLEKSYFQ